LSIKLNWSQKIGPTPQYTRFSDVVELELPPQVETWEASEDFANSCESIARSLIASGKRRGTDHTFFISALLPGNRGIASVQTREGAMRRCAVFFSSATRLADYAQLLLSGIELAEVRFTAGEFVESMRTLESGGIQQFTLDRCPRCWNFAVASTGSVRTADDAIAHWSFVKAVEYARADFYFQLAEQMLAAGDYLGVRNLALQAVLHVTLEDPRFHLMLVEVGQRMNDQTLIDEARLTLKQMKIPAKGDLLRQATAFGLADHAQRA
jgi:hypothetical protein